MELSSDLSGAKEFTIVKRGYDPDEVNAFLDQIAAGVGELKRKLAVAEEDVRHARSAAVTPEASAETDEIHRALILAQRAADEEVRTASARAAEIVGEAETRAAAVTDEADARAATVTREADERAAAVTRDAEREALRRREQGRSDLLAEIRELEAAKAALGHDIGQLETHLDEQREVVQAAIGELQSLLDHPEAFRVAAAPPATAGPVVVEPLSLPPEDEPAVDLTDGTDVAPPRDEEVEVTAPLPFDSVPPPPPAVEDGSAAHDVPAPPPPGEPFNPFPAPAAVPEDAVPQAAATPDAPAPSEAVAEPGPSAEPPRIEGPAPDLSDDDDFLAELRKAMLDDEPLGPRDDDPAPGSVDDLTPDRRPRFGRRR